MPEPMRGERARSHLATYWPRYAISAGALAGIALLACAARGCNKDESKSQERADYSMIPIERAIERAQSFSSDPAYKAMISNFLRTTNSLGEPLDRTLFDYDAPDDGKYWLLLERHQVGKNSQAVFVSIPEDLDMNGIPDCKVDLETAVEVQIRKVISPEEKLRIIVGDRYPIKGTSIETPTKCTPYRERL